VNVIAGPPITVVPTSKYNVILLETVNDPIITAFEAEARYLKPIKFHILKNVDTLN
jgi:hypothetical protein